MKNEIKAQGSFCYSILSHNFVASTANKECEKLTTQEMYHRGLTALDIFQR
jgi:hypothetical protein